MDQVFISDLVVRGIIGVNTWERENPQEILINVEQVRVRVEKPGAVRFANSVGVEIERSKEDLE